MLTLTQRGPPHPEVADTTLDTGEVILLHLETKTYFRLNTTGAQIWRGMKAGLSMQAISGQLQARFDVTPGHTDQSVLRLVAALLEQGPVERVED